LTFDRAGSLVEQIHLRGRKFIGGFTFVEKLISKLTFDRADSLVEKICLRRRKFIGEFTFVEKFDQRIDIRLGRFSPKVNSLINCLYNVTMELTFENCSERAKGTGGAVFEMISFLQGQLTIKFWK